MQSITLKYISWQGVINNLCRYFSGALVIIYFGYSFRLAYLNIIYFFSIIGLFFWGLYFITGFSIDLMPSVYQREVIFWSTRPDEFRNAGPFWEPGAYAGYLLIIPLLYLNDVELFFKKYKKKIIVLIIGLLTTMSTTGYVAFSILLIYIFGLRKRISFPTFLGTILIIYGVWFAINNVEFLGNKIEDQYSKTLEQGDEFSNTRFGAFLFDLYYIQKRPFFGNGFHESTRFEDHPNLIELAANNEMGHGNGFSNMLASVGLIFFISYVYFIVKKLKNSFTKKDIVFFIVMLVILLQGEQFLLYPLFLGLTTLSLPKKSKKIN